MFVLTSESGVVQLEKQSIAGIYMGTIPLFPSCYHGYTEFKIFWTVKLVITFSSEICHWGATPRKITLLCSTNFGGNLNFEFQV